MAHHRSHITGHAHSLRGMLFLTAATAALLHASPAAAQTEEPQPPSEPATTETDVANNQDDSEIIVTATRIARSGFTAPTPTVVMTDEQLKQGGRTDIASALNDLPQFRGTSRPTTGNGLTTAGTSAADLRGLGTNRTL